MLEIFDFQCWKPLLFVWPCFRRRLYVLYLLAIKLDILEVFEMVKFYFLESDLCFAELFDIVLDIGDSRLEKLCKDAWFAYCRWCRSQDRCFSLTDTKYSHDFISNCVALFNAD